MSFSLILILDMLLGCEMAIQLVMHSTTTFPDLTKWLLVLLTLQGFGYR